MEQENAAPDDTLLLRMRRGEAGAFADLMQQNNRRLYRLARSILRDDHEAEEAVQESYVRAFTHLDGFTGRGSLGGWLARIVTNEALGRLRRRHPTVLLSDDAEDTPDVGTTPEQDVARTEIRQMIEQAIDRIPVHFRTVFMLRAVEEMSIDETAALLGIPKETVKTRFHRANRLLREALSERLESILDDVFPFAGPRCEAVQKTVLARLSFLNGREP
jgi:RNA polymerase sigma-70 factor, ECF subfamily